MITKLSNKTNKNPKQKKKPAHTTQKKHASTTAVAKKNTNKKLSHMTLSNTPLHQMMHKKAMKKMSTAANGGKAPQGEATENVKPLDGLTPDELAAALQEEMGVDDDETVDFWKGWNSKQKKDYNEWLFAKLSPIMRRGMYTAFAVQGFQPAEEKVPEDTVLTEHLIETLVAHCLILPRNEDLGVTIPDPNDSVLNPHQDCVDDLFFMLDAFQIIPRHRLKDYKKGYINPFIEFREFDFETDAFNPDHEVRLTPEQQAADGELYTVRDALETCLKMIGVYDVQYFQDDPEIDNQLSLPMKPAKESKYTQFQRHAIKMYPFHEDPNAPLTRLADEFERDYLSSTDDVVQLHELHNQFYRHDVVSTLHPEVAEIYDAIMSATDECTEVLDGETARFNTKKFSALITPEHLMVLRGVIRDFYLQTLCYEDYLSSDSNVEYYHVNVDFDEQLYNAWQEQGEYDSEKDDKDDEEFLKQWDETKKEEFAKSEQQIRESLDPEVLAARRKGAKMVIPEEVSFKKHRQQDPETRPVRPIDANNLHPIEAEIVLEDAAKKRRGEE